MVKKLETVMRRSTKRPVSKSTGAAAPRALSLCCVDLAIAILAKQKRVENRTRAIPSYAKHSWIALHVSCGRRPMVKWSRAHVKKNWSVKKASGSPWSHWTPTTGWSLKNQALPNSSIVGFVRLGDSHPLSAREKKKNPWAVGPHCWEIKDAVPLVPPIPGVSGATGLWSIDVMNPKLKRSDRMRLVNSFHRVQAGER
mmetsp:Transcript_43987/g.87267  ORF Transcript_43987/g.87267 Transcript_43987/m.87267 type:complete len:198 (+) Transcript_43987:55-648(+)